MKTRTSRSLDRTRYYSGALCALNVAYANPFIYNFVLNINEGIMQLSYRNLTEFCKIFQKFSIFRDFLESCVVLTNIPKFANWKKCFENLRILHDNFSMGRFHLLGNLIYLENS